MRTSALTLKLVRDLVHLRGQILTIALVIASGVASMIMLRGTVDCLERSREAYYDRYRLAHVFLSLERAPQSVARRVEQLAGVQSVQTRIAKLAMVPIEGMSKPAQGQLLSLPAVGAPATNGVHLERGRLPGRGRNDEVVILEAFAQAHGLQTGHRLPIVLNGTLRRVRIVGTARSPEFVYALSPGSVSADPKRAAVIWMERSALAAAFDLGGAFNELSLRLQPGASEARVRAELDRMFVPYGGGGAFGRKYQLSSRIVKGELDQLSAIAGLVPLVFLGVTAFLMRLVLGRLITLQRPQIATLKAVGYSNRQVGLHYLGFAVVVLVPGNALGLLLGRGLGGVVLGMYAPVFRFPDLHFEISSALALVAVMTSAVAAVVGALLAVRAAVNLPPAEAMRPPSPPRYRQGLFDRLGVSVLAGPSGTMVLREVLRSPIKLSMSTLGIAGAVSLIVLGRFGMDSVDNYLTNNLAPGFRQDLALTFSAPLDPRALRELSQIPGVLTVEALRTAPIRVRNGHLVRESVLIGMPDDPSLRHLIERSGHERSVPERGVLITDTLGDILNVRVGDRLLLEVRQGERPTLRPVVSGFINEATGLQVYAKSERVAEWVRDQGAVSSVLLRVDAAQMSSLLQRLKRYPKVIAISNLKEEIARERKQHEDVFSVWTMVSAVLAAAVIFGVVYNNARISLTARSRDLASLRVLGFSRGEISSVLLSELAIQVLLAIPVGLGIGRLWAEQLMSAADQEAFRWTGVVSLPTYAAAVGVTLVAAAVSALWVRRSLDRLDLIAVLKTRE